MTYTKKSLISQLYRGNIHWMLLSLLYSLMLVGVNLSLTWLIQQFLDLAAGNRSQPFSVLVTIALGLLLAVLLAFLIESYARPRFYAKAMCQYKNCVFEAITQKSISAFSGESSALYLSALSNDTNTLETGYLRAGFDLIEQYVLFAGAFTMMLLYSPLLTLITIGFALLPVIAALVTGNRLAPMEKAVSDKNSAFTATLKDCLSGFSVIKAFRAELAMCRLFSESVKQAENAKARKSRLSVLISMISQSAGIVTQVGVFAIGAFLVVNGYGLSAGTIFAFINLAGFVVQPIGQVPELLANRKAAAALVDKLANALNENIRQEKGKSISSRLSDGISLKNLCFSYSPEKPVLQDISFDFTAGKSYAIVGGSGCGKSTLLNLLMAGRSDYSGSISFDGQELRSIDAESLYKLISLVQQNVFVFNSSIRDNISMFQDFSAEDIDKAIQLSGLESLISERGPDYLCGENGSGLSGGEKQRISIARSLLRKANVLLVDEATAALDAKTASHVASSILDLEGVTKIVVTHSMDENLLSRYDCILVLKNGSIAESGKFCELMEKKDYFYSLFTVAQ